MCVETYASAGPRRKADQGLHLEAEVILFLQVVYSVPQGQRCKEWRDCTYEAQSVQATAPDLTRDLPNIPQGLQAAGWLQRQEPLDS